MPRNPLIHVKAPLNLTRTFLNNLNSQQNPSETHANEAPFCVLRAYCTSIDVFIGKALMSDYDEIAEVYKPPDRRVGF